MAEVKEINKITMFSVYFLESTKNKKIYTGVTSKVPEARLIEHNTGSNKFTKQNGPFKLLYFEKYDCSTDAHKREKFYKTGFGRKIRDLIVKYIKPSKDL